MISAEEAERRRVHVRVAASESRIEGVEFIDPALQEILDAYVRGDIEARDLVAAYERRRASPPTPRRELP